MTDKVYGSLTGVRRVGTSKRGAAVWKFNCACGAEIELEAGRVNAGRATSCGGAAHRHPALVDLTGLRFNSLTALEHIKTDESTGNSKWLFQCDCGNTTIARGDRVRFGYTKACGCKRGTSLKGISRPASVPTAMLNALYLRYKHGAIRRKLAWNLDKKQCENLFKGQCFYCGSRPSKVMNTTLDPKRDYLYNGIDRKDNNVGYTPDNSVSACWTCNRMKGELDYKEFAQHIAAIHAQL